MEDVILVADGEDKVAKILILVFGGRVDHDGDGSAAAIQRAEGWRSFEAASRPSNARVVPRTKVVGLGLEPNKGGVG